MTAGAFYDTAMEVLARREAGAGWAELAAATGWQPSSCRVIVSRARNGRLRRPGAPRKNGWSPEADALLIAHWESENSHELARRISGIKPGTTARAVNSRAHRLGLQKPDIYGNHSEWWGRNREGG